MLTLLIVGVLSACSLEVGDEAIAKCCSKNPYASVCLHLERICEAVYDGYCDPTEADCLWYRKRCNAICKYRHLSFCRRLAIWEIASIAVGSFLGFVLVMVIIWCICSKMKKEVIYRPEPQPPITGVTYV
jgi:hypothetical protein